VLTRSFCFNRVQRKGGSYFRADDVQIMSSELNKLDLREELIPIKKINTSNRKGYTTEGMVVYSKPTNQTQEEEGCGVGSPGP
jgi:hypothetical protein